MKKILLSVCMLLISANSYSSLNTYKVDLDKTYGVKNIETLLPLELSSNKNVEIISDYMGISQKYTMTDQAKKTFIVNHPNKSAQTTLFVKYSSGEITKLNIKFLSKNPSAGCDFKLTYNSTKDCI